MKSLFLMRLRISIRTKAVCIHSNIKYLNSRGVRGALRQQTCLNLNPDKMAPQIPHHQTLEALNSENASIKKQQST